jgi:hypothetical protein
MSFKTLYDVDWIRDREVIIDVFVLDRIFLNMENHCRSSQSPISGSSSYYSRRYYIAYWENKIDAQQVHEAILIAVPKKGDLSQPKNWRPICLNDIFQKIISSTLITKNLTALYVDISRENGTNKEDIQTPLDLAFTDLPASKFQNSSLKGRGCQDGNYSLCSITQQRRDHNLGTWALFVDLRKAFDTADHDLLYKLLDIYGTLDNIINLVKQLHDDFVLKLKIGDKTRDIPYGKGVKQGDVMAPILFLFLMLAFSETLEQEYEQEWDIKPIEFKYHANIRDGQLKSHLSMYEHLPSNSSNSFTSMTAFSLSPPEKTLSKGPTLSLTFSNDSASSCILAEAMST